nr:peptide-methionine (R)-S-oxide reductase MsrB [Pseudogulbenkiania sp. NH8B]
MKRRQFLRCLSGGSVALLAMHRAARAATSALVPRMVTVIKFSDAGTPLGPVTLPLVQKDAEWRRVLSPLAYAVTRRQGTEPPFSIPGYDRHDAGLYRCVCCGNALFSSRTKYDSHTGWPSFWQPIAAQNIATHSDVTLGMVRTEVRCALCEAHLGHVFDDGPPPTGLRYCMNTVALRFVPLAKAS